MENGDMLAAIGNARIVCFLFIRNQNFIVTALSVAREWMEAKAMNYLEPMDLDRLIKFCEFVGLDAAEVLREACINKLRGIKLVKVPRGVVFATVVLCKDCVYKIGNIDSDVRNSYDFFCLRFNSYVRGDGYCDFGERKEG